MADTEEKTDIDSDALLKEAKEAFSRAEDAENDNRQRAEEDIRFSRLDDQWPEKIRKQRENEGRPCLTLNKTKAFIRQVVNDARQNKPSIKVHAVDSGSDPKTAKVIEGLIRNIEYTSNADVAYDTAIEHSVSGGFGYWRIVIDYAYDDVFDKDILIKRVPNQFSIYGDPDSLGADSSDWNSAWVINRVSRDEFKRKYRGKNNIDEQACNIDFDSDAWRSADNWLDDDAVIEAEWWRREEVEREILLLSTGRVIPAEDIDPGMQVFIDAGAVQIVDKRISRTCRVTQTILTGADVIEINEWPGRYIPIVPVYGDEIILEGKRYFVSLINSAKDSQRMYNYWSTVATETVALAPRVPWIGPVGSFNTDAAKWGTANSQSHSFIEYDNKGAPPQRQPLDAGPATGALQESLKASDDMKAIIGLYDASLGQKSNETSGRAIMARQREGDVATFHFIDNLTRAIRHTGRILIDLIPHVYSKERVVRVIGEDGTQATAAINGQEPAPEMDGKGQPVLDEMGEIVMAIHDLTAGKYDLAVSSGPSFTTRREEAAMQMTELIRAFPQAAQVVAPLLAKNSDWPGADELEEGLKQMASGQLPPEVQQQIDQSMAEIDRLKKENEQLQIKLQANTEKIQAEGQIKAAQMQQDEKLEIRQQDIDFALALRELMMKHQLQAQSQQDQARISAYTAQQRAQQTPQRPV